MAGAALTPRAPGTAPGGTAPGGTTPGGTTPGGTTPGGTTPGEPPGDAQIGVDPGRGVRVGSMCTGYGGLDLAVTRVLGGRVSWCADPDEHVRAVIAARLLGVVNLGDLRSVDWAAVTPVDVITAGFPCQDLSAAGKGAGITEGTRSGLWIDIVAAVRLLRPALVFVENVSALRWRRPGLGRVLGDLAEAGYDACWRSVRAADIGAPHQRERVFLLAQPQHRDPGQQRRVAGRADAQVPDTAGRRCPTRLAAGAPPRRQAPCPTLRRRDDLRAHRERRVHYRAVPHCPVPHCPREDTTPATTTRPSAPAAAGRVRWGEYAAAVARWERVLGRDSPLPYELSSGQRYRLNARWVEWLMGLPEGWVNDVPIPWRAQVCALGNGVVPAQAEHALRLLLTDLTTDPTADGTAEVTADREPSA